MARKKSSFPPTLKRFARSFNIALMLTGVMLFFPAIVASNTLEAQEKSPESSTCISKLQNPKLKNIDCRLIFDLDQRTQKSMQANTAGMIKNAACIAKISVTRKMIFTALLDEKVMRVPKQPVYCNILTFGEPVKTKFQMAPKIRFSGGKAVQAKPGMSDVVGMPEILAKLLTDWVNSSEAIESAMLDEVNYTLKMIRPPPIRKQ
jgi:hypothetical protein